VVGYGCGKSREDREDGRSESSHCPSFSNHSACFSNPHFQSKSTMRTSMTPMASTTTASSVSGSQYSRTAGISKKASRSGL
jgi:hypothetical protein